MRRSGVAVRADGRARQERARLERERLELERIERERLQAVQEAALQPPPSSSSGEPEAAAAVAAAGVEGLDSPTPTQFREGLASVVSRVFARPGPPRKRRLGPQPDSSTAVGRGDITRVRVPNTRCAGARGGGGCQSDRCCRTGEARLEWTFCSEMYDVSFGVEYEAAAGEGEEAKFTELLPVERYASHEKVFKGHALATEEGHFHLIFDNSYSILRSKRVFYECKLAQ